MNGKPLLSESWRDIISLGSSAATLVGFALGYWQLRKTKSAALAAKLAAEASGRESRHEFRRYVLATAKRYLIEAKNFIDSDSWEKAALRLGDLSDQVSQLTDADQSWRTLLSELRVWEAKRLKLPMSPALRKKWEALIRSLQEKLDSSHGPFKANLDK